MSIQAQLNQQAFAQLNQTHASMKAAERNIRGSMEQIALRALSNCKPCLDDMTQDQKNALDEIIVETFKHRDYI